MHKLVFVGLTGSIALTVAGCSSPSRVAVTTAPSPDSPDAPKASTAQQPFDTNSTTALVPQVSAPENIPGLIQMTNGDERARQIQKIIEIEKRQDPFTAVSVTLQQPSPDRAASPIPDRTIIPFNRTPFPVPSPRQAKIRKRTPATQVAYYPYFSPVKPSSARSKPSIALRSKPTISVPTQAKPSSPVIAVLPPLPSAALANAVEVSGVVVVGKVTQVIVKAPNEASSRHVHIGQRLSNGEILVKRVEMSAGSEPLVILEVVRTIGVLTQAANPV